MWVKVYATNPIKVRLVASMIPTRSTRRRLGYERAFTESNCGLRGNERTKLHVKTNAESHLGRSVQARYQAALKVQWRSLPRWRICFHPLTDARSQALALGQLGGVGVCTLFLAISSETISFTATQGNKQQPSIVIVCTREKPAGNHGYELMDCLIASR